MSHAGLEWVKTTFGLEPRWTKEPSITAMKAVIESIFEASEGCVVTFMGQGAFNKLYRINSGEDLAILRISLPVDPGAKTLSEVATLQFMRQYGSIPVPTVRAYDPSNSNPIGFEWILMDLMPGITLDQVWKSIPLSAKKAIVSQIAQHSASMFSRQFRMIGNIFPISNGTGHFEVQRVVSLQFFWGRDTATLVSQGPFQTSKDWIAARLLLKRTDCENVVRHSQDDDEREDAERTLRIIARLINILSMYFPSATTEQTMLFHDDLSERNILVDKDGKLTAIVDWESVSALPLWKACQFPAFLEGRDRNEKPILEDYCETGSDKPGELFWEHLKQFELTELRLYFLEVMRHFEPAWMEVFLSSQDQRDFDLAVQACDNPFSLRTIERWLDDIDDGRSQPVRSLNDRFRA